MTSELLAVAIRAQASLSLAILVVLALRPFVRRRLGPSAAYRLWVLVPAVALAAVLPSPLEVERALPDWTGAADAAALIGAPRLLAAAWILGAAAFAAWAVRSHLRFLREASAGRAGPAVIGILRPRVVTPAGHDQRFSPQERHLIALHEQAHIERGDMVANLLALLGQALCWFNPLVHLAAGLARFDQELACDRTVLERLAGSRRLYAETLVKAQGGASASPLGCGWDAGATHPLEVRLRMIGAAGTRFDQRRHVAATLAIAALSLTAGMAVWLSHPPAVRRLPELPHAPVTVILDLRPGSVLPRG